MSSIWETKPELNERLKELWTGGKSCSEIAILMGNGLTRNAIIGRVTRMKLNAHDASPRKARSHGYSLPLLGGDQPSRPKTRTSPVHPNEGRKLEPVKDEKIGDFVTMMNVESRHCRYPYDGMSGLIFCGREKEHGIYCTGHASFCYQKPQIKPASGEAA